ncbi:hypothetical protein CFC21_097052 [Triticum aestivum]|uniref:Uncharacterized protein n=3 Tax=Triticum TaxID=4564 RepID=A0A9R0Z7K1_TRITD|nr:hypothetical protein CFC21_097052 [Triticum aestivum]VAI72743.1 unnamed protein product [Triticum turgidum subsp. durum]
MALGLTQLLQSHDRSKLQQLPASSPSDVVVLALDLSGPDLPVVAGPCLLARVDSGASPLLDLVLPRTCKASPPEPVDFLFCNEPELSSRSSASTYPVSFVTLGQIRRLPAPWPHPWPQVNAPPHRSPPATVTSAFLRPSVAVALPPYEETSRSKHSACIDRSTTSAQCLQ